MPSVTLPDVTHQDQLDPLLAERMPGVKLTRRGKMTLVARDDWQTAMVSVSKKGKVTIGPWLFGAGLVPLWTILIMLTGIGLILWAVIAVPKHQALATEVHEALASKATESSHP